VIQVGRRFRAKPARAGSSGDRAQAGSPAAVTAAAGEEQKITSKGQFFLIVVLPTVAVKQGRHIRAPHSEAGIE
jgi:hypothetical protein